MERPIVVLVIATLAACAPERNPGIPAQARDAILETDPAAKLDSYLQAQVRKGFTGAVLVAKDGNVILDRTYAPAGSALGGETAFWIASNSKQFTAAAVLRLAEQGRLHVGDSITRFLPDVPSDKRGITIHHLLSHTSGLGHHYAAEGITDRNRAVRAILATPLEVPTGTRYTYSNDGYSLLAAIIEIASGVPYEEYMRTHLFEPAGLHSTGFWGYEREVPVQIALLKNPARAKANKKGYRGGAPYPSYGFRGATGIFSTTGDLYRWLGAVRGGGILSDSTQHKLFTPAVLVRRDPQGDVYYGYGWVLSVRDGQVVEARHSGDEDWLGHNGQIRMRGDDVIIVLSNAGEDDGTPWSARVSREIRELLAP